MRRLVLTILLLLMAGSTYGVELGGFADIYHAVGTRQSQEVMSSRTRLRLELEHAADDAQLFASLNAMHNGRLEDESGVKLHEAYFDYRADNWDLRLGKQIMIWGNSDSVRIVDQLCPLDLTEFITQDFDDIRIPVTAAKFRYLGDKADLELVWIPLFEPSILPKGPWAVAPSVTVIGDDEPESKAGEFAMRVSSYNSGVDFAFSLLSLWDDAPIYRKLPVYSTPVYEPEYKRLGIAGAEVSAVSGDFVVRGEAAYTQGKRFAGDYDRLYRKNVFSALLGLDWYPGNNWTILTELSDEMILNHDAALKRGAHQVVLSLNVSKKFFRELLTVSNMLYLGITYAEIFERVSIEYALNDSLHISGGFDGFYGDRHKGVCGPYRDNDQIWLKAKYSF